MDKQTQNLFYIGAAVYLNLEREVVDAVLRAARLDPVRDSVNDCREALKRAYPHQYESSKAILPSDL